MKKILIFTSSGGGGHIAATSALKQYLNDTYKVQEAYIFRDVLSSLDFIKIITFGKLSDENAYNFLIQKKKTWLLTKLYNFGNWYINTLQRKKINTILTTYLISKKPDLIISVVPLINRSILDVAETLSIPFLIVPTDLDISGYLINIQKPSYKKFFITASFNEPTVINPLFQAKIPSENIIHTGYLLRPDFFEQKNALAIKKNYAIPENKPIVAVLMGSRGNHGISFFVQRLTTVSIPLHILALVGTNETEKNKLATIALPSHISMSIVGFTKRISDLLFVADILITKTGPNSVCEALYTNTPCLLDVTSPILPWEHFTLTFIHKYHYGKSITSHDEIAPMIKELLTDKTQLEKYKKNIEKMEKKNAGEDIKKLIKTIIGT